jgi:hypothetical protein
MFVAMIYLAAIHRPRRKYGTPPTSPRDIKLTLRGVANLGCRGDSFGGGGAGLRA